MQAVFGHDRAPLFLACRRALALLCALHEACPGGGGGSGPDGHGHGYCAAAAARPPPAHDDVAPTLAPHGAVPCVAVLAAAMEGLGHVPMPPSTHTLLGQGQGQGPHGHGQGSHVQGPAGHEDVVHALLRAFSTGPLRCP